MSNHTADQGSSLPPGSDQPGERLVYVLPEHALFESTGDEINLREAWDILWRGKWIIIAVTAAFAVAAVVYALLATEWYRAEVLLAPAEQRSVQGLGGQLGGLAALAGVRVGAGDGSEAIAVLKSREFARAFIEEFNLVPVFFHDEWDPAKGVWLGEDPEEWPEIRDATKYFHENVLNVSEARDTGLVTLTIDWTDPEVAASWAGELVARLNDHLRQRALSEAEQNVEFLRQQLETTNIATMRESIGGLLETEMQKLMLAKGTGEFTFRIIDRPQIPKEQVKPKRLLIVSLAVLMGGLVAVFLIFVRHGSKQRTSL